MMMSRCERDCAIDVIFMDQIMPVMCGSEATKILRGKGYKGLIVGVTGNALEEDISLILSSGADIVLKKPLRISDLENVIRSLPFDMTDGS